jgi:hypothetical protein
MSQIGVSNMTVVQTDTGSWAVIDADGNVVKEFAWRYLDRNDEAEDTYNRIRMRFNGGYQKVPRVAKPWPALTDLTEARQQSKDAVGRNCYHSTTMTRVIRSADHSPGWSGVMRLRAWRTLTNA